MWLFCIFLCVSELCAPEANVSCPSALLHLDRLRLKCDGTRAKTRFRLSAKRTSPFKSAGASVQSTTGSRGVRISGNNVGYTMFRDSVRVQATHTIRQFPLHFPSRASPCAITFQLDCTLARSGHQAVDGVKPSPYFTKYLFALYITVEVSRC